MNKDHIREHWEEQGATFQDSHWASWGDNWMIDLEIETIGAHITDGDSVLDIGCANGYSAFRQLAVRKVKSIIGIDFAASMIAAAREAKARRGLGDEISFEEGDVRHLKFPDASFDVVYTTRVLINLPTWEDQKLGITECLRVARPGGRVILSEGFWEPLVLLNAMRLLVRLSPLVEHDFNRYLKKSTVEEYLRSLGTEFQIDDFSSVYYLGSRFLRELITDAAAFPGYSNPINKLFYQIEKDYSGGGFGIQQAVVIRK
jgi:ubiquinone/menaquinone biosynthesis C-methylase UbiE